MAESFCPTDPLKKKEEFRNYNDSARQATVARFYHNQHTKQTVEFNKKIREKYLKFDSVRMSMLGMLEYLGEIVDESDPDTNLTQLDHALQTAESCRRQYPDEENDWFHLTGLIHDLGKVLAVDDESNNLKSLPQWACVGDTFPVGCRFDESNVFYEDFKDNPDFSDERFNTPLGMYSKGCGLNNVLMSWGHDEYMTQVLKHNKCKLPSAALAIIRYHSFYPWHKFGKYKELMNDEDVDNLKWVQKFNEHDLYSKSHEVPNYAELKGYYEKLIDKYCPGELQW